MGLINKAVKTAVLAELAALALEAYQNRNRSKATRFGEKIFGRKRVRQAEGGLNEFVAGLTSALRNFQDRNRHS